jgi:hypothetical protein
VTAIAVGRGRVGVATLAFGESRIREEVVSMPRFAWRRNGQGSGPAEAWAAAEQLAAEGVKKILTQNGDFVADPQLEKYSLTFNAGGSLKRVE